MKTLSYMWREFNWLVKVGIVGGFIGAAVGIIVPLVVILNGPGNMTSKAWKLLLALSLAVIIIGVVAFAFGNVLGSQARQRALQKTGVRAEATITGLEETGLTVNRIYPVVKIMLEVRPPGGQPYQVKLRTMVSRLDIPQIQPGKVVAVVYDPENPSNVAFAQGAQALSPAAGDQAAQAEKSRAMEQFLTENDARNMEIIKSGQPAPAVVLQAMPLNVMVNGNNPAISFVLEVKPEGQPSFQAQTTAVILEAAVPRYQPGNTIYVKYDPADHSRVAVEHS
jgi:hypothetical protein